MSFGVVKSTLVIWFILSTSISATASTKCESLIEDLRSMQKAQAEVKKSLVSNHQVFAETLEEYSEQVRGESKYGTNSASVASRNMKSTANSFRTRGIQSQKLSNQLDNASEKLIHEVAKCLKSKA